MNTEKDALAKCLTNYQNLPTEQARRGMLQWVDEAARMHPQPYTRDFNAKLLPMLHEAERQLAQSARPEMPTKAEVMALFSWLGNGIAVLVLKVGAAVGGLYLIGAAVFGVGSGIVAFFIANGWIFGGAIAAGAAVFLLSGLELGKGESGGGETTHERFEQETFYQKTTYEKTTSHN